MSLIERIREASPPCEPIPTAVSAEVAPLGIRAVLFDIYGTLLISAAGEIGTTDGIDRHAAFASALRAMRLDLRGDHAAGSALDVFDATIAAHQAVARERGVEVPEVDVRDVWRDGLAELTRMGLMTGTLPDAELERLAVEFEVRVNPAWPMPGAASLLRELRRRGIPMGIISNAQFFTPLLFQALLGDDTDALGFEPDLVLYSFAEGRAKPDPALFDLAADRLTRHGIRPEHVLFVGNDRLKDVWPAARRGFKAALFAGDARSYRLRPDDERLTGVRPDVVLTELQQVATCLGRPDGATEAQGGAES